VELLATPFVFTEPGFETREIGPHEETVRRGTASSSSTPEHPAHCAEQVLYFNAQGLLQRMDYSVDVVGDMVAGATLTTASIIPCSMASSFRPSAGRSAALRRVQCVGSDGRIVTNE